jgi:HTH-type transcriptional regulator/antitoxin MqsA
MKCPVCGTADLVRDTRDLPYAYKGERIVIPAVTGDFCSTCTESVLDTAESERVMEAMSRLTNRLNAGG